MTVSKPKGATPRKLRKTALRVNDLYGGGVEGGLLQGRYGTPKVYAWFQNRHRRAFKSSITEDGYYHSDEETQFGNDHTWKVPATVRECLRQNLTYGQVNVREAWYATWASPKTGERRRKKFSSPFQAINFIATKAQYVDPHACVVSRTRAYDIPPRYRGKVPYRKEREGKSPITWYWCPLCMQPRRFRAVRPLQDFFAMVKVWSEDQQRYKWADRRLRLLECKYCECTNRNAVFRRSNQPWEVRKFKKGARRAKRRR
jgi:hypothetical protein